jgi:S1-C subfamily serine protease
MAGLLPGDEITHYDGTRIFSTFDLTRQAMQGDEGENVVVNITRDGIPMQLVIPRGPLGINTGRQR